MKEIAISIIPVIATVLIAIYTIKQTLSTESGWRSKIFDAASKEYITYSEVYTMRTALRYEKNHNPKPFSYDYLTNFAIEYCNYLIGKRGFSKSVNTLEIKKELEEKKLFLKIKSKSKSLEKHIIKQELTFEEQEIIRVILRCMLKNHWDFNASMVPSIIKYKSNQNKNYKKHVHEAFCRINEILKFDEQDVQDVIQKENLKRYFNRINALKKMEENQIEGEIADMSIRSALNRELQYMNCEEGTTIFNKYSCTIMIVSLIFTIFT